MKDEQLRDIARGVSRRVFLKSALVAAGAPVLASLSCAGNSMAPHSRTPLRFGIVTDCHYADIDPASGRYYRESTDKLAECVARMNAEHVDFLIEIGDLKDQDKQPNEARTLTYLDRIEAEFRKFDGPIYHVLGNHDLDSLSRAQFLSHVTNTGIAPSAAHYSFDVKGVHLIVLDANYKTDGTPYDHGNFTWNDANIPPAELDWLRRDLAAARGPVIVFVHQMLDGTRQEAAKNAAEVRAILESSGKVLASFQGHYHAGGYSQIAGIHYYTLPCVIDGTGPENSAYAIVQVHPDDGLSVTGYRKAVTRELVRPQPNALR
jgi:DNA repair exonuclease SbcCD nuclease subunit